MSEATILQDACVNCRFWRRLPAQPNDPKPNDGHCRRYPPVQQGGATAYTFRLSDTSEFPVTPDDGWCGEFVRKEGPFE